MKKRNLRFATMLLALVLLLTACGGGNAPANNAGNNGANEATADAGSSEGKILRTNNNSEPGSLDPALATGTHDSWAMQHMFEGLMKYNEKGEVVEGMAKEMKVSDDGLKYTFTLRDDAKWSNGDPLTAQDFEFAWKRVLDPETASEYSYQLYYLKNGEAYNNGEAKAEDVGVKAVDDKTLEVELETATKYFPGLAAFYTLYPVPKAIVEKNPDWAKDPKKGDFVTNGPFVIKDWKHNEGIDLVKNDQYYDKDKVKLAGIHFDIIEDQNTSWQRYEGGEYDFMVSPPNTIVNKLKQAKDEQLTIGDDLGTYYFALNVKEKPLNNVKVRQALSLAIDRKSIVENITQGGQVPAEGMVPFGLLDDQDKDFRDDQGNLVKEDVEEAKKLLDEGLAEEGMTKADLNGKVIVYNTDESHKKIAQAVQEMWNSKLGISVNLENMEFQTLIDRRRQGDYFISRAGWMGDYADPMTMLDLFMTGNPQNDPKWSNAKFDELLKKAKTETDQKVRMDSMKEAEKIMMEEMPAIPIYFYTQPYVTKPNVKGIYKVILNYPFLTYAEITD